MNSFLCSTQPRWWWALTKHGSHGLCYPWSFREVRVSSDQWPRPSLTWSEQKASASSARARNLTRLESPRSLLGGRRVRVECISAQTQVNTRPQKVLSPLPKSWINKADLTQKEKSSHSQAALCHWNMKSRNQRPEFLISFVWFLDFLFLAEDLPSQKDRYGETTANRLFATLAALGMLLLLNHWVHSHKQPPILSWNQLSLSPWEKLSYT